jgi:putative DNA methylase
VTQHPIISPKKLIEVALPLDAINAAAAKEKSIRHGHPSTLHLWWARRPLAAARAVIFGQLVHDPEDLWRCQNPGKEPNQQVRGHWTKARGKLFELIEELVQWKNTTNETVLNRAREVIRESWRQTCELNKNHPQAKDLFDPDKMPGLHDPFAGGGTIPLEAQRLGLEAYASDLNPVAVLINKAMIEIPPKFAGKPPVFPKAHNAAKTWKGAGGLAEDVRRYGQWMRDEAEKRIGHLYPPIEVTKAMAADRPDLEPYVGEKLTVIAWLWARTVKSPNPAFSHVDVPLASTFVLSSKEGKEAYVQPVVDKDGYRFTVRVGTPPEEAKAGTKSARGANFRCLMSRTPIEPAFIKAEAVAGRMKQRLMAIVAEGTRGRVYLAPNELHQTTAKAADPKDAASTIHVPLADDPRNLWCLQYGLTHFDHLFTPRQLVALTTFSDLVGEARERIRRDAIAAGLPDDDVPLEAGGVGARTYGDAVSVYLGLSIDKASDYWSTLNTWHNSKQLVRNVFGRQALPMTWDFCEANTFSDSSGNVSSGVEWAQKALEKLAFTRPGASIQNDAQGQTVTAERFVSTDPPYYDNIGYADLSDFFYVWLRRSLRPVFPELLSTIAVPKTEELVATPYRHGGKEQAEAFFLRGMTQVMHNLATQAHPAAPITIYYAFKQSETKGDGTNSTGWETFLDAVLKSGLSITGTWPMRTELGNKIGMVSGAGANMLASSIILVCRPRAAGAGSISRRQFVRQLNETLPLALDAMTREAEGLHSPVAPVDLSQAIIGPGMAIFSRYDAVLEADGTPMSVKTALQLINRFLAEDDFDPDTQFCLHWFDQHGWESGKFGEADTLARAKGTTVDGVKHAGVIESGGGNVRLLRWKDYPAGWDPTRDARLPIWEALHQLIRAYRTRGDSGAASVLAAVASKAEAARQLAYRLYTLCERKNWSEDARAYNEVVTGWSGIETAAAKVPAPQQRTFFDTTKDAR